MADDKDKKEGLPKGGSKGVPKRDGSGRGKGANTGRGNCKNPKGPRKGLNKKR